MRHARPDYNRIQDPAGLIPDDEPVFLIRAKDIAAIRTLEEWIRVARMEGASVEIIDAAKAQVRRMIEWRAQHGVKVPDMPAPQT